MCFLLPQAVNRHTRGWAARGSCASGATLPGARGVFFFKKNYEMRRIDDLDERVGKLEREIRRIDLEWTSTYDKFRSILARIAKRSERLASSEEPVIAESQGATPTLTSDGGPLSSGLSSRQHTINEQILARRNRTRATQ